MKRYSDELRQAVIEDYKNGEKVTEIGEKYGIGHSQVSRIAREGGLTLRKPKHSKDPQKKTCPRCHKAVDVKGARFCPYCGSDIRSENEILAEQLDNLKGLFIHIPEAQRDNFMQTINKAIDKLKEAKK